MPFSFFTGQYWKVHYRRPTRNIELQAGWRRKHHQYSDLYFVCIWKEKKKTRNLHLKLGIYFSITRSWYTYVFKIHWKVRFQIIGVFCATRKNQHVLETRRGGGSQLVMAARCLLIYQLLFNVFFIYKYIKIIYFLIFSINKSKPFNFFFLNARHSGVARHITNVGPNGSQSNRNDFNNERDKESVWPICCESYRHRKKFGGHA